MNKGNTQSGLSTGSVLGLIFIVLKLTGNIDWPWIWVLAPFWIGLAVLVIGFTALKLWSVPVEWFRMMKRNRNLGKKP